MLFLLAAPLGSEEKTEVRERRGRVAGASHVNLRSGPSISHPPITILNNGAAVNVEKLEGSWYHVTLPQGVSGYIYGEFLQILNGEQIETAPATLRRQDIDTFSEETFPERAPEAPQVATAKKPEDAGESLPPTDLGSREEIPAQRQIEIEISSSPSQETQTPKGNTLSLNRSAYTSPWKITPWILVPLCIFVLGWICGGRYYLRRDRIERTRLRF